MFKDRLVALVLVVLALVMTLTNCGGGGGDGDTGNSSSPSTPIVTNFAPDSDTGGTYTFVFDNGDGTVFTAYIRSATSMEGSVNNMSTIGRHSYMKTSDDMASGMFQWSTFVWWEVDLTFTSRTRGTFVVTNYQQNNTGRFTLTF